MGPGRSRPGGRLAPDDMNMGPSSFLGIEPASDVIGRLVVSALRKVSGCSANSSPSSGNWKSRENLVSLFGLAGKLMGKDFLI